MRHLQQSQFEVEALFLPVSKFRVRAQHDLQMPRQVFLAEKLGDAADAGAFIGRNLQQRRVLARDLRHRGIPEKAQKLARKMRGAVSFADQLIDQQQNFFARTFRHRLHHAFRAPPPEPTRSGCEPNRT